MGSMYNRPLEILLIEDNQADAELTQEAMDRSGEPVHLQIGRAHV